MDREQRSRLGGHAGRLASMSDSARDAFDTARGWASGGLFLAGALGILGSLADWVRFTLDENLAVEGARPTPPLTGFDVGDGWWAAGASLVMIAGAFLLVLRARPGFGGLCLIASIVLGAIAISDYRGVSDYEPKINFVGEPHAAIGLILVVAAAILGLFASIAGIAATPRARD